MVEQTNRSIWQILLPFLALQALLSVVVVWRGQLWALWGLAAAPLVLLVLAAWTSRRWAARSRDQLPEYIVSRTVHGLVHDWNRAEYVQRTLQDRFAIAAAPEAEREFLDAAAKLEPFVGRVRATGYWEIRRSNLNALPLEVLQDASRESRDALRARLLALSAEALRRATIHLQQLQGLRQRGLYDVAIAPFQAAATWDELLAQLNRMQTERSLAVDEALRVLDPSTLALDPRVVQIREAAASAHQANDDAQAIEQLLRIVPAPAKTPAAGKGRPSTA